MKPPVFTNRRHTLRFTAMLLAMVYITVFFTSDRFYDAYPNDPPAIPSALYIDAQPYEEPIETETSATETEPPPVEETEASAPEIIPVAAVTLSKANLTLGMGDSVTLTAKVSPYNSTETAVSYSSSDTNVARVDGDGRVRAHFAGNAVITASCGDVSTHCYVTVFEQVVTVESLRFGTEEITLEYGRSYKVGVTVSPSNVTDNTVALTADDYSVVSITGFTINALRPGKTIVTGVSSDGGASDTLVVNVNGRGKSVILDVPYINQRQKYPTGCEIVSAVMALQYAGIDVTPEAFIDSYLDMGPYHYSVKAAIYGPNPNEFFSGSPYSLSGYGCYSPVIIKALNRILDRAKYDILAPKDKTLSQLCDYIDDGLPVIIWATESMAEAYTGSSWAEITYTGGEWKITGNTVSWISPEHCMLLVGYDNDYFYFNDPLRAQWSYYKRTDCEAAFEAFGRQAVIIREK